MYAVCPMLYDAISDKIHPISSKILLWTTAYFHNDSSSGVYNARSFGGIFWWGKVSYKAGNTECMCEPAHLGADPMAITDETLGLSIWKIAPRNMAQNSRKNIQNMKWGQSSKFWAREQQI